MKITLMNIKILLRSEGFPVSIRICGAKGHHYKFWDNVSKNGW